MYDSNPIKMACLCTSIDLFQISQTSTVKHFCHHLIRNYMKFPSNSMQPVAHAPTRFKEFAQLSTKKMDICHTYHLINRLFRRIDLYHYITSMPVAFTWTYPSKKAGCFTLQYSPNSHLMHTQCFSNALLVQGHIFRNFLANHT